VLDADPGAQEWRPKIDPAPQRMRAFRAAEKLEEHVARHAEEVAAADKSFPSMSTLRSATLAPWLLLIVESTMFASRCHLAKRHFRTWSAPAARSPGRLSDHTTLLITAEQVGLLDHSEESPLRIEFPLPDGELEASAHPACAYGLNLRDCSATGSWSFCFLHAGVLPRFGGSRAKKRFSR